MISFVMNGNATTAADDTTVSSLVGMVAGRDGRGIAVAINDEVTPRSLWDVTRVVDGDRVEILTAAQGG